MFYLIDLDSFKVVGKQEKLSIAELYAEEEITANYDIVDSDIGFSVAYPKKELEKLAASLDPESPVSFKDEPLPNINSVLFDLFCEQAKLIPTLSFDPIVGGHPPMASKKKTTTKKAALKKKATTKKKTTVKKKAASKPAAGGSRSRMRDDLKIKRGDKTQKAGTVFANIYDAMSGKATTVADLVEGMLAVDYTPPRRKEPADATYLKGYISAMIKDGQITVID